MRNADWDMIKWSFLSRLPSDKPGGHLPFYTKLSELNITHQDSLTQEVKALQANERCLPSDTIHLDACEPAPLNLPAKPNYDECD